MSFAWMVGIHRHQPPTGIPNDERPPCLACSTSCAASAGPPSRSPATPTRSTARTTPRPSSAPSWSIYLAQAGQAEVRQATEAAAEQVAADQPAEARLALACYLSQVPA